jgi:16S rRNA (adenine(1408)-N(1))-methyltransferase
MHIVKGKQIRQLDAAEVAAWSADYPQMTVDLGTGDGRFVRHLASQNPQAAAIGVDLRPENVRNASRAATANALFVIADALALPEELSRVATHLSINFPWGSLLHGVLSGHPGLLAGLAATGSAGTTLEIRLNSGALAEAGWTLESGGKRVAAVLRDAGFTVAATSLLAAADLRCLPSTWAKRLAFGRDPRALRIAASLA